MNPVAEYNLAEYYRAANNNSDRLSLLRSFFGCLASAIQYLPGQQIRHHDIKPEKILVKGDCACVTDFGISYTWENLTRGTTTTDSAKTLTYAAPEEVRVEARNELADIWSLSCVFLELVTVLEGKTVEELRRFLNQRSDMHHFHANQDEIREWMDFLEGSGSRENDVPSSIGKTDSGEAGGRH